MDRRLDAFVARAATVLTALVLGATIIHGDNGNHGHVSWWPWDLSPLATRTVSAFMAFVGVVWLGFLSSNGGAHCDSTSRAQPSDWCWSASAWSGRQ